jgi:outer membrane lipoprotein-sorting protein
MTGRYAVRTQIPARIHHIGMSRLVATALVLTISPVLTMSLAAQSLDETFARMDKTSQQLKTVVADIKRDVHTSVINDDSVDSGTFKLKREKSGDTRMLIDFTGNDAKTVSLGDGTVSIYYPKIKTIQVYDVGARKQVVEQFLLLGFGASSASLKEVYEITWVGREMIGGQQTSHLKLIPKSRDMSRQVASAELWIGENNGLPIQQKIVFTSGDYWLVTYSSIKFNPVLSDDDLKLKTPKGIQIQHPRF